MLHTFQRRKQTPLHEAVRRNYKNEVELMLQSGAEVNRKDEVKRIYRYMYVIAFTATVTSRLFVL